MRLLEMVGPPEKDSSKRSLFWRQQAGNRLANRYYDDGNFILALRIYQGMAAIDSKPSWQLPVIYQIGLCFEKLSMNERAIESYMYINDQLEKHVDTTDFPSLANLGESASWRLELLSWKGELGAKVDQLVMEMPSFDRIIEPET